jgi:hypothetical protein
MTTIQRIKIRLEQGGFDGLYASGECGCLNAELAPCGSCETDAAGWINGCSPGYRHSDPRPGHGADWAISGSKVPLSADDFAMASF